MPRRVALGDGARVRALVVALVREADGERPHRLGRGLRHQRDDDRRVDPAREQRAERHVGDEPLAHGGASPPRARARATASSRELRPLELRLPVALDRSRASPSATSTRRRARAAGRRAGRCACRGRTGARGTRRARRGPARGAGPAAASSAFSSEANASVPSARRVQTSGFLPSRSRASTSRPRARVPERDREHPLEPLDEARAVLLVQVRDHRRVAAAAHVVARSPRARAQLGEVVELAVEDRDHVAALVRDRLVAELRVDHLRAAGGRARTRRRRRSSPGRARGGGCGRASRRRAAAGGGPDGE